MLSHPVPVPAGAIEKGRCVEPGFFEVSFRCEQQSIEELRATYAAWVTMDGWQERRGSSQGAAGWSLFVHKQGTELTIHGYVSPKPHDPPPMLYLCAERESELPPSDPSQPVSAFGVVVPLPPRLAPGRVRATPDREQHAFALADFAIANFAIANVGAVRDHFVAWAVRDHFVAWATRAGFALVDDVESDGVTTLLFRGRERDVKVSFGRTLSVVITR